MRIRGAVLRIGRALLRIRGAVLRFFSAAAQVGLELQDVDVRRLFQKTFAKTWDVGIDSVVYSTSARWVWVWVSV